MRSLFWNERDKMQYKDKIKIRNLEVFGNHGVFKEENTLGQKFLVNATLYTDTRIAGRTDTLTDSIHYGDICHFITEFMREHTFKLLESVAEQLAESLLLEVPRLWGLDLEIKKPWAPIGLPIETVSVEISRSWHKAYLSVGSNMGDKEAMLKQGIRELQEQKSIQNVKVSDFLETEPYGVTDQDRFLNGCVALETLLTPQELLQTLHEIEANAGRERKMHWGPRTLDMDILFYDNLVYDSEDLYIPHIDMQHREFVLRPLAELCPGMVHPVLHKTVKQMLDEL